MSFTIGKVRQVADELTGNISTLANTSRNNASTGLLVTSLVTLLLLLLVALISTIVARSLTRPLRKLRADALDVAGNRLPAMVRRLSQSEGADEGVEIEPIGVTSTDEIGEVARAFDQVDREAVRLAADEAMPRGNLNAMFINLSRRSQSLIERQLSLIDSLEQSEQDSSRLSSLFRLDHLATRMRRNSENLLVLAGHEVTRRWSQPVPLVDVWRAAIGLVRGRPPGRQARHPGPAAARSDRRPDCADLAAGHGGGARGRAAARPASPVRGGRLRGRPVAVGAHRDGAGQGSSAASQATAPRIPVFRPRHPPPPRRRPSPPR